MPKRCQTSLTCLVSSSQWPDESNNLISIRLGCSDWIIRVITVIINIAMLASHQNMQNKQDWFQSLPCVAWNVPNCSSILWDGGLSHAQICLSRSYWSILFICCPCILKASKWTIICSPHSTLITTLQGGWKFVHIIMTHSTVLLRTQQGAH